MLTIGLIAIIAGIAFCGWHIIDAIKFVYGGSEDDFSE